MFDKPRNYHDDASKKQVTYTKAGRSAQVYLEEEMYCKIEPLRCKQGGVNHILL